MGLVLKHSMDAGAEWEVARVVSGSSDPQQPEQLGADVADASCSCLSHIHSARPCNLCLQFLGRRKWMVPKRQRPAVEKKLARGYISQTWAA